MLHPRKSINNIPYGIAVRCRQICDSDEKVEHQSEGYKNCLVARDYHPGLLEKQFHKVKITSRHNVKKKYTKKEVSKVTFIAIFTPTLPNIGDFIRKHICYLHSDEF